MVGYLIEDAAIETRSVQQKRAATLAHLEAGVAAAAPAHTAVTFAFLAPILSSISHDRFLTEILFLVAENTLSLPGIVFMYSLIIYR